MASNVTHLKEEGAQNSLKARMAALMEECAKYRELASKSSTELEQAKAKRSQVGLGRAVMQSVTVLVKYRQAQHLTTTQLV